MTAFTRTFGGQVVSPTSVSYATYSPTTNLTLFWPFQDPASGNVLAWQNDIATGTPSLPITFPDATLVSVGASALINNTGTSTLTILANDGLTTIGTVASGQQWYFYLVGNSNAAGQWRGVQFGAGTSSASAASLAGAGLTAVVTKLNQNLVIQPKVVNYSPTASDLATVLQSTGGSVVWTPGSAATFGNGWFVYVINDGSGTLTWTPSGGQLIDNAATKVFQPTESAVIFSDGANFWSLGYGRALASTVTAVSIPLTGTPTLTLSSSQAAAQVQDYSGVLAAPTVVTYGTGPGFWFVRNATSGALTLTAQVNGSDAGVVVPQGAFTILRSNGTNMSIAFTATSGTVTSVATTANLTGGPITTSGTLDLSSTGVSAGAYGSGSFTFPQITVDIKGRITAASSVTIPTSAAAGPADASKLLLLDSNGLVPSINGGFQTGDVTFSFATSKPGWVLPNAQTIGNAGSGASQRANADTQNLYTLLWNNTSNTVCPVSTGRGASAAADFTALKTLGLPDMRGTVAAALDNLGGAASAGRLSSVFGSTSMGASTANNGLNSSAVSGTAFTAGVGISGTALTNGLGASGSGGYIGGNQLSANTPGTTGGIVDATIIVSFSGSVNGNAGVSGSVSGNASVSGGTASFVIVQSTMVMNAFLKL